MEVQILNRRENPLLKRVEVRFKAIHKAEATPTRDAVRSELAKHLKATKDVVVIDGIASTFGRYETLGYAKVYRTKDQAVAVERRHILVRNKLAEPEAKEAKPGEAARPPKVEKPGTPKKEEAPKAEAKPEAKPVAKPEKAPAKEAHKEAKLAEKKQEKKDEKKAEKPETKKAEPKKKEGK